MEIDLLDSILDQEKVQVAEAMKEYGGGFVQALSACILAADRNNLRIIWFMWRPLWEQYLDMKEKEEK